jgi:hypothetical protein
VPPLRGRKSGALLPEPRPAPMPTASPRTKSDYSRPIMPRFAEAIRLGSRSAAAHRLRALCLMSGGTRSGPLLLDRVCPEATSDSCTGDARRMDECDPSSGCQAIERLRYGRDDFVAQWGADLPESQHRPQRASSCLGMVGALCTRDFSFSHRRRGPSGRTPRCGVTSPGRKGRACRPSGPIASTSSRSATPVIPARH